MKSIKGFWNDTVVPCPIADYLLLYAVAGPGIIVFTTAEQLFVVQAQTRMKEITIMIDLKRPFLILKFN